MMTASLSGGSASLTSTTLLSRHDVLSALQDFLNRPLAPLAGRSQCGSSSATSFLATSGASSSSTSPTRTTQVHPPALLPQLQRKHGQHNYHKPIKTSFKNLGSIIGVPRLYATVMRAAKKALCTSQGEFVNCKLTKFGDEVAHCQGWCGLFGLLWFRTKYKHNCKFKDLISFPWSAHRGPTFGGDPAYKQVRRQVCCSYQCWDIDDWRVTLSGFGSEHASVDQEVVLASRFLLAGDEDDEAASESDEAEADESGRQSRNYGGVHEPSSCSTDSSLVMVSKSTADASKLTTSCDATRATKTKHQEQEPLDIKRKSSDSNSIIAPFHFRRGRIKRRKDLFAKSISSRSLFIASRGEAEPPGELYRHDSARSRVEYNFV
ncbi:unnamed protein product [Amoebophrya sp. A120]|nr:unnamed protein product [Amoebophrya sp. A120]|eukprot:GSA120T00009899001.1